jgi:hypothetical protein
LKVIDCLDYMRTQVERRKNGTVKVIGQAVFREGCSGDSPIFKIPEGLLDAIFVSEEFKMLVEQHNLKGLNFYEMKEE